MLLCIAGENGIITEDIITVCSQCKTISYAVQVCMANVPLFLKHSIETVLLDVFYVNTWLTLYDLWSVDYLLEWQDYSFLSIIILYRFTSIDKFNFIHLLFFLLSSLLLACHMVKNKIKFMLTTSKIPPVFLNKFTQLLHSKKKDGNNY